MVELGPPKKPSSPNVVSSNPARVINSGCLSSNSSSTLGP